jgi:hypothetical protein
MVATSPRSTSWHFAKACGAMYFAASVRIRPAARAALSSPKPALVGAMVDAAASREWKRHASHDCQQWLWNCRRRLGQRAGLGTPLTSFVPVPCEGSAHHERRPADADRHVWPKTVCIKRGIQPAPHQREEVYQDAGADDNSHGERPAGIAGAEHRGTGAPSAMAPSCAATDSGLSTQCRSSARSQRRRALFPSALPHSKHASSGWRPEWIGRVRWR